jgi:uncharacterized protein YoxC
MHTFSPSIVRDVIQLAIVFCVTSISFWAIGVFPWKKSYRRVLRVILGFGLLNAVISRVLGSSSYPFVEGTILSDLLFECFVLSLVEGLGIVFLYRLIVGEKPTWKVWAWSISAALGWGFAAQRAIVDFVYPIIPKGIRVWSGASIVWVFTIGILFLGKIVIGIIASKEEAARRVQDHLYKEIFRAKKQKEKMERMMEDLSLKNEQIMSILQNKKELEETIKDLEEELSNREFITRGYSGKEENENKVLIIGDSEIDKQIILNIAGEFGHSEENVDVYLDYSKIKNFRCKKIPKYKGGVLVGPVPHSVKDLGKSESLISKLEREYKNGRGVPYATIGSGILKISANSLKKSFEELEARKKENAVYC